MLSPSRIDDEVEFWRLRPRSAEDAFAYLFAVPELRGFGFDYAYCSREHFHAVFSCVSKSGSGWDELVVIGRGRSADGHWRLSHFVHREKPRPEWIKLRARLALPRATRS